MIENNTEGKRKRFRFPVAIHLREAVGALTLHTGVETLCIRFPGAFHLRQAEGALTLHTGVEIFELDIKNARILASFLASLKLDSTANVIQFAEPAK